MGGCHPDLGGCYQPLIIGRARTNVGRPGLAVTARVEMKARFLAIPVEGNLLLVDHRPAHLKLSEIRFATCSAWTAMPLPLKWTPSLSHRCLLRRLLSLNGTHIRSSTYVPVTPVMVLGDVADSPGGCASYGAPWGRHESLRIHKPRLGPCPEYEVVVHGQTGLRTCAR